MAIYTIQIQNEQYCRLLNDVVKVLSILLVFYTYVSLYYKGDMKTLFNREKVQENVSLFILAFAFYHLVVNELVVFI